MAFRLIGGEGVAKAIVRREAAAVAVQLCAPVEVVAAFREQTTVHEPTVVHVDAEGIEGGTAVD